VRFERSGSRERYFIKFHGQVDSPEIETSLDVFKLYYKEFKKPLENKRNEPRRHIENGEIDGFIISGKLTVAQFEQEFVDNADFEAALKTCTPVQQRRFGRFGLYRQGYTLEEITEMENCTNQAVSDSVTSVNKKIKKYFS